MSETTKRSSHRGTGPVDAAPRLLQRNLMDSPRRRARLAEVEARFRDEHQAADVAETSGSPVPPQVESQVESKEPEAVDLFTSWLHENGFQDLAAFQKITRQAESAWREQHSLPQPTPSPLPKVDASPVVPPNISRPGNLPRPGNSPDAVGLPEASWEEALPVAEVKESKTGGVSATVASRTGVAPNRQGSRQRRGVSPVEKPTRRGKYRNTTSFSSPGLGFEPSSPVSNTRDPDTRVSDTRVSNTRDPNTRVSDTRDPVAPSSATVASLPLQPSRDLREATVREYAPGRKRLRVEPPPEAASSAQSLRYQPTVRMEVKQLRSHKHHRGDFRPDKTRLRTHPRPLSKTRKVPVLLTLGVLFFVLAAGAIPVLWYQSRVAATQPEKARIEVLGAIGAHPVLTLSHQLPLEKKSSELRHRGKGNPVSVGKTVALRITVFSGVDGRLLSTSGDESVLVAKLSPESLGTEVYQTIRHATEGSRYLLKHPVKVKGTPHMEIGVIDVISTSLRGSMTSPPPSFGVGVSLDHGVPVPNVTQGFSGDLQVDTLISGKGAPISAGQSILVKYREYSYSNPPDLLKDHWDEPVKLKLNDSLQLGVARGIVDQKVGSRLLIQVPPAQGSGSRATILIVDVLAAWDPHPVSSTDSL